MTDNRSADAAEYRKLYATARWKRLRDWFLSENPLCARCIMQEIVEPATVVHHKDAHRGDPEKFWGGPFEALCAPCHNKFGQLEDHGKTTIQFGPDGWPL